MKKQGRPSSFNEKLGQLIIKLYKKGYTDRQVAKTIGVSRQALHNWKKKDPDFFYTIKEAKDIADEIVINSLYARATGYNVVEEKLFHSFGKTVREKTLKHYPPDVAACIYWLNNRRPEEWRNSSRTELLNQPPAAALNQAKKTFRDFCQTAGYPLPYDKQIQMFEFAFRENVGIAKLLLGARGYGKTDYLTILGVAFMIYLDPQYTALIITKSRERNTAILGEIGEALKKNDVQLEMENASSIRVVGLHGKDNNVSAVTIKTKSLRGRHPNIVILDDPVTEDDASEATRKHVERVYNECNKLTADILVIGQPVHKFDLYSKLRPLLMKMEVPHGTIPELDHDLEAQRLAGVSDESISASYHLNVLSEGTLPFDKMKMLDKGAFPKGGTSVAFIDPSDGGNDTAITILKQYGQGIAAVGFTWKKRWDHCLDDIAPLLKEYNVAKLAFETNKHGEQPIDILRQVFKKAGLQVSIVGRYSITEKHSKIMACGVMAHMIHLSKDSHQRFIDQVVQYEYKAKVDDAPDSLASCLEWIGLIRGKG
jgi:hypothetical protein